MMPDSSRSTIFALSSGRPPAAIAVIRISGPRAGAALEALGVKIPAPRQARIARIRDPESSEIIDEALALWFPAPNSETGEDVAELQGHGGPAVIAGILDALSRIDGLRMAEPGEFTRRGFENGKLDLTAVEGLADLVSAETEAQRRLAFRQMKGQLGDRAEAWRERLVRALALVEARIDFSDEADVPEDLVGPALAIVQELRDEIATALADGRRGERLRDGLVVAIAGPPNAGKSTLLNRLARREVAIVSPYAGTTRDVIEVHLDLGGYPLTLLDTAGVRETGDPVEMEGVRRARERAAAADLVLWVTDASAGKSDAPTPDLAEAGRAVPVWQIRNKADLVRSMDAEMLRTMGNASGAKIGAASAAESTPRRRGGAQAATQAGRSRAALASAVNINESRNPSLSTGILSDKTSAYKNEYGVSFSSEDEFILSASEGLGLDRLMSRLSSFAATMLAGAEQSLVARARHRDILAAVQHILNGALDRSWSTGGEEELLAEQLRQAAMELGRLAGRVDVEDVLDIIFRDFCIGK
ncbi:tRNA uridine-5-carboxymethylaminomethyl(34) synthesis GTPase MnmE [Undibacter mobilis]|uniref:tRNA modification GTPase MnmE n=1 Tax=Undibacter mobilis TaxID=2292256 RepID=A0A371B8W5_9BRAD|nr:tRNA uridine-5-carboxymethylaminomethyl(34) synthesis GTPase MnmE [Undibacter mobilis]RDV04036.1 tRNA uridine-5-carboxymethylaminomethyl(34) synthesis GTPase MnmE [Undibacter mobilis]